MSIDDIFDVSKEKDESWKQTRIRFVIAAKIMERLHELGQMDLVDSVIGSLKKHITVLEEGNKPLEDHFKLYIDCEILKRGRSLTPQDSPIDCLISKMLEFTKTPLICCEQIYQGVYDMVFKPNSEFRFAALNEKKLNTPLHEQFQNICRNVIDNRVKVSRYYYKEQPWKDELSLEFYKYVDCTVECLLFIADVGIFVSERHFYLNIEYGLVPQIT